MTQIVLRTAIWSLFLIFSISSLNAQLDDASPPILDQIPPGTAIIDNQRGDDLNDDSPNSLMVNSCDGFVDAYVYVTNLWREYDGAPYSFPYGATPIFLSYEIGTGTPNRGVFEVPAASFEFNDMVDQSGMDVFESRVQIPIDFTYICPLNFANYKLRIVSDLGGSPYLFKNNNGPNDLFSCHVFCSYGCNSPDTPFNCIDDDYFDLWEGQFPVSCRVCIEEEYNNILNYNMGHGDNITLDKNDHQIASESTAPLQVMPNPASLETDILFYSEIPEAVDVLIFDATGRTVYKQSTQTAAGDNKINISINTWEKGVYYGYLKSKNDTQSFRFLKL